MLGLLKPLLRSANIIESCNGLRVGIDAWVWLHEYAAAYAEEYMADDDVQPIVRGFIGRCRWLARNGVVPLLVFDGAHAPAKGGTKDSRDRKKADAFSRYEVGVEEGAPAAELIKNLRAAVSVTFDKTAKPVIEALRSAGFAYVVAPYEADPQLAQLAKAGVVDAVITIDSDLMAFGCKKVFWMTVWGSGGTHVFDIDAVTRSTPPGECPLYPLFSTTYHKV